MNEKEKNQELVKIARNMREDISLFHKYLHEKGLMLDYAEWLIRNKKNRESEYKEKLRELRKEFEESLKKARKKL